MRNTGTTISFPCCCFALVTLVLLGQVVVVCYACDSAHTRYTSARTFCCWQASGAKILRHGWSQHNQSKPVLEFFAAQSRVGQLLGVDLTRPRSAVIGFGAGVAAKPSQAKLQVTSTTSMHETGSQRQGRGCSRSRGKWEEAAIAVSLWPTPRRNSAESMPAAPFAALLGGQLGC